MDSLSRIKYAELICVFYPGNIINKIFVNKTFANRLVHVFEKLKAGDTGRNDYVLSYTHGFFLLCCEQMKIQIYGCSVIATIDNVISAFSDPKRKIERMIVKEYSRKHFKRAADYEAISRELNDFQRKAVFKKNHNRARK